MATTIREEQIYAFGYAGDQLLLGERRLDVMPWRSLRKSYLYAVRKIDLERLLSAAVLQGYSVSSGHRSERRGLRAFTVDLGAYGHMGSVSVALASSWGIDPTLEDYAEEAEVEIEVAKTEAQIRAICTRLLGEAVPFRSSGLKWLTKCYQEFGFPLEKQGHDDPLPGPVADLGRAAHIGGPILHARTTLSPYVSIDRSRAYGTAMLEAVPSGPPIAVPIEGYGLHRWRPHDLQRHLGLAIATVRVFEGPAVPLLPVLVPGETVLQHRVVHPIGLFRGAFTLFELAALEARGLGRVERFWKIVDFEESKGLAPVVRYLRGLEPDLGPLCKRLEHLLYGRQVKGLTVERFGSVSDRRRPLPRDVVDDRVLARLGKNANTARLQALAIEHLPEDAIVRHPVYTLQARLDAESDRGDGDRPERCALIVARNRVALGDLITTLDPVLKRERSGDFVGRVYVDGIDVEGSVADLERLENTPGDGGAAFCARTGTKIKGEGQRLEIYRAGFLRAVQTDGTVVIESGGMKGFDTVMRQHEATGSAADLRRIPHADIQEFVRTQAEDAEGPFSGGRLWLSESGGGDDPRLHPNRRSEPIPLDEKMAIGMGLGPTEELIERLGKAGF